jgi:hypothetical protein
MSKQNIKGIRRSRIMRTKSNLDGQNGNRALNFASLTFKAAQDQNTTILLELYEEDEGHFHAYITSQWLKSWLCRTSDYVRPAN